MTEQDLSHAVESLLANLTDPVAALAPFEPLLLAAQLERSEEDIARLAQAGNRIRADCELGKKIHPRVAWFAQWLPGMRLRIELETYREGQITASDVLMGVRHILRENGYTVSEISE